MSDGFDGFDGADASHVDAGEQHFDLDHGASQFGSDQDHSLEHNAFGQADSHEEDVNYNHGHAVEFDSPAGAHYAEQDYTNFAGHEADTSASYGENLSEADHAEQFGNVEHLQEQFDAAHFDATAFQGDGGEGHISAVSN
jgi:hypothetical protein